MKLLPTINLVQELIKEKNRGEDVVQLANELLQQAVDRDRDIIERLSGPTNGRTPLTDGLDPERIFTLDQIQRICVRFRLRFLDSKYFRSTYPYEAICKINELEQQIGKKIAHFKIIAPDHLFQLENINKDPLLFAELEDGNYYLIHKWGNDLVWHRRLLSWPLASFRNFLVTLIVACSIFAFSLPTSILHVFNAQSEFFLRAWLSIHFFIALFGISLWYGLTFDKTFSNLNWNSKYYNY
jgi:hypothetical protein